MFADPKKLAEITVSRKVKVWRFDCLDSNRQEVLSPGAGVCWESWVRQFADQDVRDNDIKW